MGFVMIIKEITKYIDTAIKEEKNFFYHKDMVIVGENRAGKSTLLKEIIKNLNFDNVYFIDDKNRCIPTKLGTLSDKFDKLVISDVVKLRIDDDNFNKCDIFSDDCGSEVVLSELVSNKQKYELLFYEVLGIKITFPEESNSFDIEPEDIAEDILIDSISLSQISSSVQSKLRILMEVNYAYENGCKVIIIDEFNTNLDSQNAYSFYEKLKMKYYDVRFIITSHSIYTVQGIKDADILKIYKQYDEIYCNNCEYFDSNDLDNIEIIDKKLFNGKNVINEKDIELSNYLKKVVANKLLDENDRNIINEMHNLTPRQQVVCNYIKGFIIEE